MIVGFGAGDEVGLRMPRPIRSDRLDHLPPRAVPEALFDAPRGLAPLLAPTFGLFTLAQRRGQRGQISLSAEQAERWGEVRGDSVWGFTRARGRAVLALSG